MNNSGVSAEDQATNHFLIGLLNAVSVAISRQESPHREITRLVDGDPQLINDLLPEAFRHFIESKKEILTESGVVARSFAVLFGDFAWSLHPHIYRYKPLAELARDACKVCVEIIARDDISEANAKALKTLADAQLALSAHGVDTTLEDALHTYREAVRQLSDKHSRRASLEKDIRDELHRWYEHTRDARAQKAIESFLAPASVGTINRTLREQFENEIHTAQALMLGEQGTPWELLEKCDQITLGLKTLCDEMKDTSCLIRVLLLRGSIKIRQSMVARTKTAAGEFTTVAISELEHAIITAASIRDSDSMADARVNLADACAKTPVGSRADRLNKAIMLTEAAIDHYQRKNNTVNMIAALGNMGHFYMELAQLSRQTVLEKAIVCFQKAYLLSKSHGANQRAGEYLFCLGRCHFTLSGGEASEHLEKAVECFESSRAHLNPSASRQLLWQWTQEFGRVLEATGRLREAAALYTEALNTFEVVRLEAGDPRMVLDWWSATGPMYGHAVRACLSTDDIEGALSISSRGKNRLETEREALAKKFPEDRSRLALEHRLIHLHRSKQKLENLSDMSGASKAERLEAEFFTRQAPKIDSELSGLLDQYRSLVEHHKTDPQLEKDWFDECLGAGRAHLESTGSFFMDTFYLGGDGFVVFLVRPNGEIIVQRFGREELDIIIDRLFAGKSGYFNDDPYRGVLGSPSLSGLLVRFLHRTEFCPLKRRVSLARYI